MSAPLEPLDDRDPSPTPDAGRQSELDELAGLLRAGRLVAFPTETVYGLGANALDADAVRRIFAAKGRPATIPLIVHLASADQLPTVTADQPALARKLAAAFWPGPLTLVLPRAASVPDVVTAGLDTVGVRVPAHPMARALIAAAGVPIAAPSANPFAQVSPTTADHVRAQLGDRVDAVLDGGPADVGIESTVVDASGRRPILLRPGGIPVAELTAVVGPIERAAANADAHAGTPQPSPGSTERHYAPRARLVEVTRAATGGMLLPEPTSADVPWALITIGEAADRRSARPDLLLALPKDAAGFARQLFAALHDVDAAGCELAFVERLPDHDDWEAIADRLRRAGLMRTNNDGTRP